MPARVCAKWQIAVHFHGGDTLHDLSKTYEGHAELLELLGISRERIILVEEDVRNNKLEILTWFEISEPGAVDQLTIPLPGGRIFGVATVSFGAVHSSSA